MPGVVIPGEPDFSGDAARGTRNLRRRGLAERRRPRSAGHVGDTRRKARIPVMLEDEPGFSLPVSEVQPKTEVGDCRASGNLRIRVEYLKVHLLRVNEGRRGMAQPIRPYT
jgi:hypothetical protein